MKRQMRTPTIPSVVIAISAALLGIALGLGFAPNTFVHKDSGYTSHALFLSIAVTGVVALIVVALVALKSSADRQLQMERDLLEAFLEHIPDNVFFKDRNSRFV